MNTAMELGGFCYLDPAAPVDPYDTCLVCGRIVRLDIRDEVGAVTVGDTHRTADGRIFIGPIGMTEGAYCHSCAALVRMCRACGCTDEVGCPDGCWWVAPDLCSSCEGAGLEGGGDGMPQFKLPGNVGTRKP